MLRRGFALLEVTIAITILAIGAAILIPVLARADSRARAVEARDELDVWILAAYRFSAEVERYPKRLSQLVEPIISTDPTNCTNANTTMSKRTANWNSNNTRYGPFYRRRLIRKNNAVAFVLANGFGSVDDNITRLTGKVLAISISAVVDADATELDALVDASNGSAAGTVQWGAAVEGVVTVTYRPAALATLTDAQCGA